MPWLFAIYVLVACTVTASAAQAPARPIAIRADTSRVTVSHPIVRGERLASIMLRYGVDPFTIAGWVDAAKPVADLGHIEAGRTLTFTFTAGHRLTALSYDRGEDGRVIVEDTGSTLHARIEEPPVVVSVVGVRGTVERGFHHAAERAGVPDPVVSRMVDLLSRDIDFRTDVHRGDRFRLLFEQRARRDGRLLPPGRIIAADYVGRERSAGAFLYSEGDGEAVYVDHHGEPLEGSFLRYPLEFTRISSEFSEARFHPILKQSRPHLGVDFAALTGTPVRAVGAGVVRWAAWKADFGFHVEVDHGEELLSTYSHLRGIARRITQGARVARGQLVGWVGQTGLATGPHLHFAMFENNVYRDPLTMNPSSRGTAVDHGRFRRVHTACMQQLRSIPGSFMPVPSTAPETLSALAQARRQGLVVLTL
jgi:murein DD-endopeptidase MepM/ murein hydrolase activator NlpD